MNEAHLSNGVYLIQEIGLFELKQPIHQENKQVLTEIMEIAESRGILQRDRRIHAMAGSDHGVSLCPGAWIPAGAPGAMAMEIMPLAAGRSPGV